MEKNARDYLSSLYLDWINNYVMLETFAEHHGLTVEHAKQLLSLAHDVRESKHPDA